MEKYENLTKAELIEKIMARSDTYAGKSYYVRMRKNALIAYLEVTERRDEIARNENNVIAAAANVSRFRTPDGAEMIVFCDKNDRAYIGKRGKYHHLPEITMAYYDNSDADLIEVRSTQWGLFATTNICFPLDLWLKKHNGHAREYLDARADLLKHGLIETAPLTFDGVELTEQALKAYGAREARSAAPKATSAEILRFFGKEATA